LQLEWREAGGARAAVGVEEAGKGEERAARPELQAAFA
jgi:hypothetical protein